MSTVLKQKIKEKEKKDVPLLVPNKWNKYVGNIPLLHYSYNGK